MFLRVKSLYIEDYQELSKIKMHQNSSFRIEFIFYYNFLTDSLKS